MVRKVLELFFTLSLFIVNQTLLMTNLLDKKKLLRSSILDEFKNVAIYFDFCFKTFVI